MRTSRLDADLAAFLSDESRLEGGRADEVAWPETAADVSRLLAEAQAARRPVTISGAGTGVVGGRVPRGGLVIATDRFTQVGPIRVGPDGNARMRVGAGVALSVVQDTAAASGFLYPPDPTEAGSWIGGNIATNASGARSFRFGPTRRYVAALSVVLPDGTILELERGAHRARDGRFVIPRAGRDPLVVPAPDWDPPATSKHVAGYYSAKDMDLVDLFIGSEGTLGVVIDADLMLLRAPEETLSGILFFPADEHAFALVDEARDGSDPLISPMCLEYFAESALEVLRGRGISMPTPAGAAIFFEQPATTGDLEVRLSAWVELASRHGASEDSWLADTATNQRAFREFRHLLPVTVNETLAKRRVRKVSTDTAVPRGRLAEMLRAFRDVIDGERLERVEFGHVGNDHVHVNIVPRDDREQQVARELYGRLLEIAVAMGGSVSGEHGLGKTKARYLRLQYPPETIEKMRVIKRALDPAGILGQGTLLDATEAGGA